MITMDEICAILSRKDWNFDSKDLTWEIVPSLIMFFFIIIALTCIDWIKKYPEDFYIKKTTCVHWWFYFIRSTFSINGMNVTIHTDTSYFLICTYSNKLIRFIITSCFFLFDLENSNSWINYDLLKNIKYLMLLC